MTVYQYTDCGGEMLTVVGDSGDASVSVSGGGHSLTALIPPGELPRLVPALYQACGQPAPVILPRPRTADASDPVTIGPVWLQHTSDPAAPITLSCQSARLTRLQARELAAALACWADEPEPDPADVAVLDDLIRDVPTHCTIEDIARAVLTAGWTRRAETTA